MGELWVELAVELPFVACLRIGARRRERRPDRKDHRLSVQVHRLLLLFGCISGPHPNIPPADALLPCRCSFMWNRRFGTSARELTLRSRRCQRNERMPSSCGHRGVIADAPGLGSAPIEVELVAPRFERPADLAVHARLR